MRADRASTKRDYQLGGKVVFITGAGGGIGRSIAEHFGREGAAVVVTDVNKRAADTTAASITDAGGKAAAFELDVTDREAVFAVVGKAAERFGRIDVLVNNAGVVDLAKIEEISNAEFDRLYGVNIKGKLWCMQAGAGAAHAAAAASSILLDFGAPRRLPYAHYSSSKAAVWR